MVARRYPQARQFLTEALRDFDLQVRMAAIAGLGIVADSQAQTTLKELMKHRVDGIRAEAVTALAHTGAKKDVLDAAADMSWRVRLRVAEALAAYPDRDGAAVAAKLFDDPSAEVERKTVATLAKWPLEQAGPLLLAAMSKEAFITRKTAADQLAARWPPAAEFSADGPSPHRKEILDKLQAAFGQQFNQIDQQALRQALANSQPASRITPSQLARVQELLAQQDWRGLREFGPGLPEALAQLTLDRRQVLPEMVYRQVLPHCQPVFEMLVRLAGDDVAQRRRAAAELAALAQKQPLSRLAVARLSQQAAAETDPLVWQSLLTAVADDPSEPAARLAYAAISHPAEEVRRRACLYLTAHATPDHASVLLPALQDQSQTVVFGAIRRWRPAAGWTIRGRFATCSAPTANRFNSRRRWPWPGWAMRRARRPWNA